MHDNHTTSKSTPEYYGLELVKNDTTQVANFLGCSSRMVAKLCENGDLRAFKVGNRWRITGEAVLEFAGLR